MRRLLSSISFSLLLFASAQARTGAELITDLRILLGQVDSTANATNWSNAQLRRILNMGQDAVTARGRVIERDTTYLASAATRYAPPSGFITLRGTAYIVRRGAGDIVPIALTSADSIPRLQTRITKQSVGDDEYSIYEEAGKIVVSPPVLSQDSVKVVFFSNPTNLVDTTECEYGDEWEIILLYESALIAYEKTHDEVWFELTIKERDTKLDQMYKQTKLRPQMVVQP